MPYHPRSSLKQFWQYATAQSMALPLGILFVVMALLVSPVGEFPLNDDWIHAKTVQHLLATGQYKAHPYINATLVAQSYWGALFCKIFGFSFTNLRLSTLVLAFFNAWAVAKSGVTIGISRNLALLCGAIVATSPLVLQLTYSFMTDVPFLTLSTLSGYFFLKAFRQPKPQFVAWGSGFAALAFLVRQFGIILPVAFGITVGLLVWRRRYACPKAMIFALLAPWIAVASIYLIWGEALISDTPILEFSKSYAGPLMDGLRHVPIALCYLGLFALPLGVGKVGQLLHGQERWSRRRWLIWSGFCGGSLLIFWLPQILYWAKKLALGKEAAWLHNYPYRMPLMMYRTLLDLGLGPLQLPDPGFQTTVQIQEGWWWVTFAALGVSGLLFMLLMDQWQQFQKPLNGKPLVQQNQDLFIVIWATLALATTYNPFRIVTVDRYLLVALVPFVLLLGRDLTRRGTNLDLKPILICTVMIGLFSLASLQDYLAWNRAAWVAHRKLEVKYHVNSELVEGIDTFNGWYNSEAYMKRFNTRNWWSASSAKGNSPWALSNQYVVASVEPRKGYQILERVPYFSWLGWRKRAIVIFQRL